MGQMTFAVMLGCATDEAPAPKGKSWSEDDCEDVGGKWVDVPWIFEKFKWGRGPRLKFDEERETMGFFVAAGASGKDGVPNLSGPIDFATFEQAKSYAKACQKAREQWARLVAYAAAEEGALLPEPRLFLVETEVA